MNKVRKNQFKHAGEWVCKAACIILLVVLAGLFSSCQRMHMDSLNPNSNNATQTPNKNTQPPETSVTIETAGPSTPSPGIEPTYVPTETPSPTVKPTEPAETTPKPQPSATPRPQESSTPAPTPKPQSEAEYITNPYVRYTWDQMMDEAEMLKEKYSEVISLSSAGESVEGRDLLLIKLGSGEKKIMLCGSHHAREYISSSYLMRMVEVYASKWSEGASYGNYDVKDLLKKVTIYVVPMVNPDGVNLVNNGVKSVSNQDAVEAMAMLRPTYREWKANINGVDLNRQYPAHWDEKYDNIGQPASENYKGPAYASEPEVQAMMELSEENSFILAASFHTKGNMIYWADRGTVDLIPGVEAMTRRMSKLTGYQLMPVSEKPSVYGAGYENWFRLKFSRPAFCIELTPYNSTDVPHDDKKLDTLVWNNARYLGLFLADEALNRQ